VRQIYMTAEGFAGCIDSGYRTAEVPHISDEPKDFAAQFINPVSTQDCLSYIKLRVPCPALFLTLKEFADVWQAMRRVSSDHEMAESGKEQSTL
jgi:hypothetical protein